MASGSFRGYVALLLAARVLSQPQPRKTDAGFEPPAPKCNPFMCPAGQKPVGNPEYQFVSPGCEGAEAGVHGHSKGSGKDLNRCCVTRDICRQTCGTTAEQCHHRYWNCARKVCGQDGNCKEGAMMAIFENGDGREIQAAVKRTADYKTIKHVRECSGYEKMEKEACRCVPENEWQSAVESNLKKFFDRYDPAMEKLDAFGNVNDLETLLKKYKGKETKLFVKLLKEYRDKAVKITPRDKQVRNNKDIMERNKKDDEELRRAGEL